MLQLAQSAPWAETSLAGRTGLDELISRVQGLATLHDLLSASEWSPLPLSELVEQIIHATWQILPWDKGVSLEVEPSPFHVTPDQSHHLAMIFNELATNTIKYAWRERDAAVVNVSITPVNGRVQLVYRDDGPGYPDEVLQQKRWHVGLNLVQFIVRANLGGDLSIYNDEGAVTTIRFVLETNYKLRCAQETQRDGRGE
jgi:two-component sensor histidine kinase